MNRPLTTLALAGTLAAGLFAFAGGAQAAGMDDKMDQTMTSPSGQSETMKDGKSDKTDHNGMAHDDMNSNGMNRGDMKSDAMTHDDMESNGMGHGDSMSDAPMAHPN